MQDEKIEWMYDSTNEYDKQIIRTIEKLGYEVEKSAISRSTLNIKIDVDINDNLAENFMEAVKKIYTACNFDEGSYSWVFFVIDDETGDHPDDRCRIVASKSSWGSLAVTLVTVVDGPNFEKYAPDFNKKIAGDEFFLARMD